MTLEEVLHDWMLFVVEGADADNFLEGQLTQKIIDLPENQWRLSTHVNTQGRALGLIGFFRTSKGFALFSTRATAELSLKHLLHYARFSQVQVRAQPASLRYQSSSESLAAWQCQQQGSDWVLSLPEDKGSLQIHWQEEPTTAQHSSTSAPNWAYVCYCLGWAFLQSHQTLQYLPHDLGYVAQGAVNFRKGCFTGQEIIARMHYKAKQTKTLIRLIQQPPTEPKELSNAVCCDLNLEILYEGQRVGTLLSYVQYEGQNFALAIATPQAPETGIFHDAEGRSWQRL